MRRRRITIEWDDDEGLTDEETLFAFEKGEFDVDDLLFLGDSINLVTTCVTVMQTERTTP